MSSIKTAIIIGAGPAGLTAAYEFIKHTNIKPIVLEMSEHNGGISRTINHNGNLIDIGGHRFFSKSDVVMDWWKEIMPIESKGNETIELTYHNKTKIIQTADETLKEEKNVFLVRNRLSRILFLKKLFFYPLKLNFDTLHKVGVVRSIKICFSYLIAVLFPIKKEKNLEDFFINRFGKELYYTFFKDYTEKVWGIPCKKIPVQWGKQRIKGLNITKIIVHFFSNKNSINQKNLETSLIEKFLYPKYGPGQLWDLVAKKVIENGGEIHYNSKVTQVKNINNNITEASITQKNGDIKSFKSNYFISSMPIKNLVNSFTKSLPIEIHEIANGLVYRDFITVGLLVEKMSFKKQKQLKDNWIYIQEKNVNIGRLQIFNNWSPYMVKDNSKIWLGLEYFCNEGDALWSKSENEFKEFAISELESIEMINSKEVLDSIVIKQKKAYPTYFGTYSRFEKLIDYFNSYENLFLIGRNGMHKYNNQDHSMLTAIQTVSNIKNGVLCKKNIWDINTEEEYYEKNDSVN